MKQTIVVQRIFTGIILSSLLLLINSNISNAQTEDEAPSSEERNVVRDSAVVLLGGKTLEGNDFIHLYDTRPYIIMNGHIAAKLPCDDNSESPVKVLIGSAPNLRAADFELVSQLSVRGVLCLYHVDLESLRGGNASDIITDIAIQNPTQDAIEFSGSATVVIGINEIMKGASEQAHEEGEGHAEENQGFDNATNIE